MGWYVDTAEIGVFYLAVTPDSTCSFKSTPARFLHAALLRRLELVNPALSAKLHDNPESASSIEKPWTVSSLSGDFQHDGVLLTLSAGQTYHARITALTPSVIQALQAAFDSAHPLGREPLIIGQVPFPLLSERCYWDNLTTYASLLTMSRPITEIILQFISPAGFRTRSQTPALPEPQRSIQGYLRKWNAFSELPMQTEPLLNYVNSHLTMESSQLEYATADFRTYYQSGWVGGVKWRADSEIPFLLRMVNALVNYSFFCGTGMKTTQGMGQTVRI